MSGPDPAGSRQARVIADLLPHTLDRLEVAYERAETVPGVPTGIAGLDALTGGLNPTHLVVVGARPGIGKTSVGRAIALHAAADAAIPTLLVGADTTEAEQAEMVLVAASEIPLQRMRRGAFDDRDWQRVTTTVGRLAQAPLFLAAADRPVTTGRIIADAEQLKGAYGLGLIVVDDVHRVSDSNNVVDALKQLARDLHLPIMVTTPLERDLDRSQRAPTMADLAGPAGLEDADIVLLLQRGAEHANGPASISVTINVAKQRGGPSGHTEVSFVFDSRP